MPCFHYIVEAEPPYHIRGKEEERSHGAILAPLDMQLQGVAAEDAVEIRGWCKNNLAGKFEPIHL